MRIAVAVLLLVHGLIHLIGFLKPWKLAAVPQLSGRAIVPLLGTWVIPVTEWKAIRRIEMPVRGGAVWKLASGDFDYFQWEIVDVEVNRTTLWGED